MKEVRILSLDERGRLVIPKIVRKSLGLHANSQLMMVSDSDTKTIKITPVGLTLTNPVQYNIKMEDSPGSLGKIATLFGELGISLVYGEAMTQVKDKTALWTVIGPSPDHIDLDRMKAILIERGGALEVNYKKLE